METINIIDSVLRSRALNECYRWLKHQKPIDYPALIYVNNRLYEEAFFRYSNYDRESQNKEFTSNLMSKLSEEAEKFNSRLDLEDFNLKLNKPEEQK